MGEELSVLWKFFLGLGTFVVTVMAIAKFITTLNTRAMKPFLEIKAEFIEAISGLNKRIDEVLLNIQSLEHRVDVLEKSDSGQELKILDSMKQRRLLLGAIYAILKNQVEMGCVNEDVEMALKDLDEYFRDRPFLE